MLGSQTNFLGLAVTHIMGWMRRAAFLHHPIDNHCMGRCRQGRQFRQRIDRFNLTMGQCYMDQQCRFLVGFFSISIILQWLWQFFLKGHYFQNRKSSITILLSLLDVFVKIFGREFNIKHCQQGYYAK